MRTRVAPVCSWAPQPTPTPQTADADGDDAELRRSRRVSLAAIVGYAISIPVGAFLPAVALTYYLCLAVYLVVPLREFAHLLSRPAARG